MEPHGPLSQTVSGKRPNLLFVLVDQMRYHALGSSGNEQIHTPNLDRLAQQGTVLRNAVSNIPVCTPARACLLTGRYPLTHTVLTNNSMLPPDMPSLGTLLKAAGYSTGYIGKWHLAGEGYIGATEYNDGHVGFIPPGEMRHGFDYWAVHHCSHNYRKTWYYGYTPEATPVEGWEPDIQTDLAIDFLNNASRDETKPFALVVSWGTPHTPFIAPEEDRALYVAEQLALRQNVVFPSDGYPRPDSAIPPECAGDPETTLREWTANYYGAITNIDRNMGRLMSALQELGMEQDTIVVFTSDHGEMLGSHGHLHKLQPWDESIRVPFLLRYPRAVPRGLSLDMMFNQPDVLPTLLSLMDIDPPEGIEGEDLSAILRGEKKDDLQRSAFLLWPCSAVSWGKKWTFGPTLGRGMPDGFLREYRGVRTQTHTYVQDLNGPWMLYDNARDPWQQHNLVCGDNAAIPQDLEEELSKWLDRTEDGFQTTEYYLQWLELLTGRCTDPEKLKRTRQ